MTRESSPPARIRGRHLVLLAALAVCLAGSAVWANLWKADMRVHEVLVRGNGIIPEREILDLAAVPKGQKLFEVDLFAVRARVQKNAFIRQVSVNRDLPDRITIDVDERVPVAAVAVGRPLYLDADGFLLPHRRSELIFDIPVLTGDVGGQDMVPGRRLASPVIREALALLSMAQRYDDALYRRISEIHIDDAGDMTLYTAEAGVRVLFGHGETPAKLAKFDAFWQTYVKHQGAAALEYIDLRFEDQVVVRWRRPLSDPFPS
jgi:cell division protein FtsQ